jgi:3-isopropylmalate dehydrogenase
MLRYSLNQDSAAKVIEDAVASALDNGVLTADLLPASDRQKAKNTSEVGDYICKHITDQKEESA